MGVVSNLDFNTPWGYFIDCDYEAKMKKTYLMTIDFDHKKNSLAESLGSSKERIMDFILEEMDGFVTAGVEEEICVSEMIEKILDSNSLQGGDVIYLFAQALLHRREMGIERLFRDIFGVGGLDD